MISTVTTTTVTTVTALALGGSFALVSIGVLFVLLVQRELMPSVVSSRSQRLGQALVVGIVPLLIAFVLIVIFKIVDVLH